MRSNPTRVEHTSDTHDYGFIQSGSVNNSFPMLTGYYRSIGLCPYSSSSKNEEKEEIEENEEFESEPSLSNELDDCSNVSANSSPTAHDGIATPVTDIRQYLVASTTGFEGMDSISTDMDMWSTSESSLCTTTSTYSDFTPPSYAELLYYSPPKVEQPQPMDAILVPRECVNDPKLRCSPEVVIITLPIVEQAVSLQDHCPQTNVDKNIDFVTYNSPPEVIEIPSREDSDMVMVE